MVLPCIRLAARHRQLNLHLIPGVVGNLAPVLLVAGIAEQNSSDDLCLEISGEVSDRVMHNSGSLSAPKLARFRNPQEHNVRVAAKHDDRLRALGVGQLEQPRRLANRRIRRPLERHIVHQARRIRAPDALARHIVGAIFLLEPGAYERAHGPAHVAGLRRRARHDERHLLAGRPVGQVVLRVLATVAEGALGGHGGGDGDEREELHGVG